MFDLWERIPDTGVEGYGTPSREEGMFRTCMSRLPTNNHTKPKLLLYGPLTSLSQGRFFYRRRGHGIRFIDSIINNILYTLQK